MADESVLQQVSPILMALGGVLAAAVPGGPVAAVGEALVVLLGVTVQAVAASVGAERAKQLLTLQYKAIDLGVDALENAKFPK